ncbi:unnamed protein product [Caenorhabditis brenneri]
MNQKLIIAFIILLAVSFSDLQQCRAVGAPPYPICPEDWMMFERRKMYFCANVFYNETRYFDAFLLCQKQEWDLAVFPTEEEWKAVAEAARELSKEMGGGDATFWTYHDDHKEGACEKKKRGYNLREDQKASIASYKCYQTKKMYACMKLFKITYR